MQPSEPSLTSGGTGMKVFSGHLFVISYNIPDSVATINSLVSLSTACFSKTAVEPTTSASATTGWQYAGVFADEAKTGTKDSREGFQKMIAAIEAGYISSHSSIM